MRPPMLIALALAAAAHALAAAEVPAEILYQGRLREDRLHVTGTRDIAVRLYAAAEAERPLWTEDHPDVAVIDGLFQLALGSRTPLDDATLRTGELWIEVAVAGEPLPRTRLTSTPHARVAGFAGRAASAERAAHADHADAALRAEQAAAVDDGAIDTAALADAAVTEPKLAAALRARLAALEAQATERWSATGGRKVVGSSEADWADGLCLDAAGNLALAGYTFGDLAGSGYAGSADLWLGKWDRDGIPLWTRQLGGPAGDYAFGLCCDASGNLYAVGSTEGDFPGLANAGSWDVIVSKWSPAGELLWTRGLGSSGIDVAIDCAIAADGRVIVGGYTDGALPGQDHAGDWDVFVAAWEPDGTRAWIRQHGSPAADLAGGIATTSSGGGYLVGYSYGSFPDTSPAGAADALVVAFADDGAIAWTRLFGSAGDDFARGVATTTGGTAVVVGDTDGDFGEHASAGGRDLLLLGIADDGALSWSDQHGSPAEDRGVAVAVDHRDRAFVTGTSWGDLDGQFNIGREDFLIAAWNGDGAHAWTRLVGTPLWDFGFAIAVDANSEISAGGYSYGALDEPGAGGDADVLVLRLRPDGSSP